MHKDFLMHWEWQCGGTLPALVSIQWLMGKSYCALPSRPGDSQAAFAAARHQPLHRQGALHPIHSPHHSSSLGYQIRVVRFYNKARRTQGSNLFLKKNTMKLARIRGGEKKITCFLSYLKHIIKNNQHSTLPYITTTIPYWSHFNPNCIGPR